MSGSWFPTRPPSVATVWRCGPSSWADAGASLGYQIPTSRGLPSESGTLTRWKPTVPAAPVAEESMRTTSSESVIFIEHLRFWGAPRREHGWAFLLEQIADIRPCRHAMTPKVPVSEVDPALTPARSPAVRAP